MEAGLHMDMDMEAEEHPGLYSTVVRAVVVAAVQAPSNLSHSMVVCLLEGDAWQMFDCDNS